MRVLNINVIKDSLPLARDQTKRGLQDKLRIALGYKLIMDLIHRKVIDVDVRDVARRILRNS